MQGPGQQSRALLFRSSFSALSGTVQPKQPPHVFSGSIACWAPSNVSGPNFVAPIPRPCPSQSPGSLAVRLGPTSIAARSGRSPMQRGKRYCARRHHPSNHKKPELNFASFEARLAKGKFEQKSVRGVFFSHLHPFRFSFHFLFSFGGGTPGH